MSKQHRGRSPSTTEGRREGAERARPDHGLDAAELLFGNAAALVGLEGQGAGRSGWEAARDVALPVVGRAVLALELLPRDASQVQRFLEIIDQAHLPSGRQEALSGRLRADQAAAEAVRAAVEACVGEDSAAGRAELAGALDTVFAALEQGAPQGAAWTLPDGRALTLSGAAPEGELTQQSESLVSDLARALVEPALAERIPGDPGVAVRDLCAAVHLALLLAREEDEEAAALGDPGPNLGD